MFCDICEMFLEKRQPQEDYPILATDGSVAFKVRIHSACKEHAPLARYEEGIGQRTHGKWSTDAGTVPYCSIAWTGALCAICRKDMEPGQSIVDAFYYEPDGSLDCIELAHEGCAHKETK